MEKAANLDQIESLENIAPSDVKFLQLQLQQFQFTFQEIKQLLIIAKKISLWDAGLLEQFWPTSALNKKEILSHLNKIITKLSITPKNYLHFKGTSCRDQVPTTLELPPEKKRTPLGVCPVASEKTLCCNLLTLDSIQNCGLGCSYCSIQSFYSAGKVYVDQGLSSFLDSLVLEKNKTYHIGTGQSSDSLLLGNHSGNLASIVNFALKNPQVIFELKTKTKNVTPLLKLSPSKNIIVTWSINPDIIIKNEEHFTASLEERLQSARQVANHGLLVGFHFHPMFYYQDWQNEYSEIVQKILNHFHPNEVAMISFGTLTFTKKVLRRLRDYHGKSLVLQMPLTESDGKFSYPVEVKIEMFKKIYDQFKAWHNNVFFYLCMENKSLWKPVFGFEFENNQEFEKNMHLSYLKKINQ